VNRTKVDSIPATEAIVDWLSIAAARKKGVSAVNHEN
jgi:hypothetical protein